MTKLSVYLINSEQPGVNEKLCNDQKVLYHQVRIMHAEWLKEVGLEIPKGQLNSEWIYEVIVSPKMPTKNLKDFCPGSLLEGRAEILQIFGWHFGRNDDLLNSFWI